MKMSVRFAGMGGQGIIFAGIVLARAAALYEKREGRELYAIQTQSYGPAARGESSKCDVVICDEQAFYPFVERPDFLVVMSQPAFDKYIEQVYQGTIVILEEDVVEGRPDLTYYGVNALKKAERLGKREAANMVMLGTLVQISGAISREAGLRAINDLSPMGSLDANEAAFREGYAIGKSFQSEG
jgi:2-oxoglutarate ferredoxin oxidoreductase subunit gamma